MTWHGRIRRMGALAALAGVAGCAYFNGVYNSRQAARAGDRLADRGRDGEAAAEFATSAAKAESVLARYPRSRWRVDALFLAGRGAAHADRCEHAAERLHEFLSLAPADDERRPLAELALGRCLVRQGAYTAALELIAPLTRSKREEVAEPAALWAARASTALGRTDDALAYLGPVNAAIAQWELASASLARQDYARAESLLVLRARANDYREDVKAMLAELWGAGRRQGANSVVAAFVAARIPSRAKAELQLRLSDYHRAVGDDSAARVLAQRAERAAIDTLLDREAEARLALLSLSALADPADIRARIEHADRRARGATLQRRLKTNLLLLEMLMARQDYTGASTFLAAEVARDSLRAPKLALSLFQRVPRDHATSPIAPKALLAAAALLPDSAESYRRRVVEQYPLSPFAAIVRGERYENVALWQQPDHLLRTVWQAILPAHADSVRRLQDLEQGRPANAAATANPASTGS